MSWINKVRLVKRFKKFKQEFHLTWAYINNKQLGAANHQRQWKKLTEVPFSEIPAVKWKEITKFYAILHVASIILGAKRGLDSCHEHWKWQNTHLKTIHNKSSQHVVGFNARKNGQKLPKWLSKLIWGGYWTITTWTATYRNSPTAYLNTLCVMQWVKQPTNGEMTTHKRRKNLQH